jgi:LysM repeat protein
MRYFLFAVFCFVGISSVWAQITREEYIAKYQVLAINEMNRSGIPASIKMAQACLESGNGNSELSKKSNNHFGIKCKSSWTGKSVRYDDDSKNECFRKYNSVEDSYIDHTDFLMNNPRYYFLFELDPTDYVGWAHGLKKAGYATAKDYAHRLIKIIEENQLYRLDYRVSNEQILTYNDNRVKRKDVTSNLLINPYNSHQVTKRNNLKTVVAKQGDTYEIIAEEFQIKAWELYRFNDQTAGYQPQKNEIVYIESKHKKAGRRGELTHRVSPGETMHYISQMYGLKLLPLLRRNGMRPGEEPRTEEVIFLRNRRK